MNNDKSTLTIEERQMLSRKMVQFDVSVLELELLQALRGVKHGKFTIQMLDGIPFRYETNVSKFFEGSKEFGILNKKGVNDYGK